MVAVTLRVHFQRPFERQLAAFCGERKLADTGTAADGVPGRRSRVCQAPSRIASSRTASRSLTFTWDTVMLIGYGMPPRRAQSMALRLASKEPVTPRKSSCCDLCRAVHVLDLIAFTPDLLIFRMASSSTETPQGAMMTRTPPSLARFAIVQTSPRLKGLAAGEDEEGMVWCLSVHVRVTVRVCPCVAASFMDWHGLARTDTSPAQTSPCRRRFLCSNFQPASPRRAGILRSSVRRRRVGSARRRGNDGRRAGSAG